VRDTNDSGTLEKPAERHAYMTFLTYAIPHPETPLTEL
jgi:hypothetical protein